MDALREAVADAAAALERSTPNLKAIEQYDALVRGELQRTAEHELSALGERQQPTGQAVDLQRRVAVDKRDDALGFGAIRIAGGHDRIAAHVVEGAAADVDLVADIHRIEHAEQERRLDEPDLADATRTHELAHPMPLRVITHHERLYHATPAAVARRDDRLRLYRVQRDRLLAQHVLARLECPDRPFDVQVIGQRVIDRIDVRVVEQRLVAAETVRDAKLRRDQRRPVGIARCDRGNHAFAASDDRRDHALATYVRGTEDSPPYLRHRRNRSAGS